MKLVSVGTGFSHTALSRGRWRRAGVTRERRHVHALRQLRALVNAGLETTLVDHIEGCLADLLARGSQTQHLRYGSRDVSLIHMGLLCVPTIFSNM